MGRRSKTVTIETRENYRDSGKVFVLTEMPAMKAERWAIRALLALSKSGVDIPEDVQSAGVAGVAVMGLRALGNLNFADAEPLLDEMMGCIKISPSPNVIRELIPDDIEEVETLLRLRAEVFTLHTGFSVAGNQLASTSSGRPLPASLNTKTFRAPSGQ